MENLMQEIESVVVGENKEPMVNVMVPVSVFQKIIQCSVMWGQTPSQWLTDAINIDIERDFEESLS